MMRALRNDSLRAFAAPALQRFAPNASAWGWKRVAARVALVVLAILVLALANLFHATLRGAAVDVAPFNPVNIAAWDIAIFRAAPSTWLQDLLGTSGFWANVAFAYWSSLFWFTPLLVALVAVARGRWYFMRLILLQFVLVLSADVFFSIVPTRPPWMDLDVVRIVATQDSRVDIDANPYAALPSLHVAVPMAIALWFYAFEKEEPLRRLAPAILAWALGMGWCVVYTGEHYVIDVVAGYVWAGVVVVVLSRLGRLHAKQPAAIKASTAEPAHLVGETVDPRNPSPREQAA